MNVDSFILHPFDNLRSGPSAFILYLANGTHLAICAGDEAAASVVNFLARTAQLSPAPCPLPSGVRRLLVGNAVDRNDISTNVSGTDIVYPLEPTDTLQPSRRRLHPFALPEPLTSEQWHCQQLVRLSACIAHQAQPGGVLLHSGLALLPSPNGRGQRYRTPLGDEGGILLAGRSGVGKSTATRRLPWPWRSLADDATLVVRDAAGAYWAHPWPTWSRFFGKEKGDGRDTWDVQQAVPLRAIFILEQGEEDQVEPLGPGHAVALLTELAQQTATHFLHGLPLDEIAAFNRLRFENICSLVRSVPAYTLHVSLEGAFWDVIAHVMR